MNQLEGRIEAVHGHGAVRVVEVSTPMGLLAALVLDLGSPDRPFEPGRRVRALFKETSPVAAAAHHQVLEGRVERLFAGEAVCELDVVWPSGQRVRANMPHRELPPGLAVGDAFRLHVPAAAIALEVH